MTAPISVADYYRRPAIRRRIREYCGASDDGPMTCVYLTAVSSWADARRGWGAAKRYPPDTLEQLLESGADIARSIWDSAHLLLHLDIDYINIDYPGEAYRHPADTFLKLEPVYTTARRVLRAFGLRTLTVMTGRGYHFTGRIPIDDPVVDRLAALAPETPAWLATTPSRLPSWITTPLPQRVALAHIGLGLVIEFLAHRVMQAAAAVSPIAIVLNGTHVGSGWNGRECASIDLSAAGDPLDARHMRVAYSAYQGHRFRDDVVGPEVASMPPLVAIPRRTTESTWRLLREGRTPPVASATAQRTSARLPLVGSSLRRAIDAYRSSALAAFHRQFYEVGPLSAEECRRRFGTFDAESLPPCVAAPLTRPNDLLLQPAFIQHLTRYLIGEGWHPRTVAELVYSRYTADYQWEDRWTRLNARTRADYDVRAFAALLATGLDQAVDFNCRSAQEKTLCPLKGCTHDLRVDRERLLKTVHS